jgi:hypothetical protein
LIDNKASNEEMAEWAKYIYFQCTCPFENGVKELMFDLTLLDLPEPGLVYSTDDLIKLCLILLKGASLGQVSSVKDLLDNG